MTPLPFLLFFLFSTQPSPDADPVPVRDAEDTSPLSAYSAEWNRPEYRRCNTAAQATYMSPGERKVIYILNLMRSYPKLFAQTVARQYPDREGGPSIKSSSYYQSLLETLLRQQPLPLLEPDPECYTSARCHAETSGEDGYVGHERLTDACEKKTRYNGECIHYGHSEPLAIVMSLLIDEGVTSLGHRKILLDKDYKKIAVAIRPHSSYRNNAVLDLAY